MIVGLKTVSKERKMKTKIIKKNKKRKKKMKETIEDVIEKKSIESVWLPRKHESKSEV